MKNSMENSHHRMGASKGAGGPLASERVAPPAPVAADDVAPLSELPPRRAAPAPRWSPSPDARAEERRGARGLEGAGAVCGATPPNCCGGGRSSRELGPGTRATTTHGAAASAFSPAGSGGRGYPKPRQRVGALRARQPSPQLFGRRLPRSHRSQARAQAGPSAGGWQPLSFDGAAFHLKGTGELTRALLVLRLCAWPPLVTHGLALQAWSQRFLGSRLSGALLRASVYGQFVAGETAEEVRGCVQQLQTLGLRPLLAVPTEEEPDSAVKTGEAWYEGNLSAMLRCVDLSRGLLETPGPTGNILMQLKVTALTSSRLCKELTSWVRRPGAPLELSPERLAEAMDSGRSFQVPCLNAEQNQHLQSSLRRLQQVVQYARAQHVRLLVDAEYTSLNPALSLLVAALAMRWNSPREGGPWVWNTYQAYLKDTYERLRRDAEAADRSGLAFGVKLVRGAYLDKERKVALFQKAKDPTQPDYEATRQSYSRCLELMLTHVSHHGPTCHLMVASHNEETIRQATKRMWELGIPLDGPVCFGQLLGMCDHVSLALGQAGYAVYKSIPYGSLEEVIPYLIRRAQENRSVLQGARRERELLSQELRRRLLGGT